MKRYYYTDPIKALYMMKEFGMMAACEKGFGYSMMDIYEHLFEEKCADKYYVYKSSEDIFEPTEGDMGVNDFKEDEYYLYVNKPGIGRMLQYWADKDGDYADNDIKIIMRNNTQFFMPEVEND